jgi:1-acyl-sn-glycerol-3-phosphate acyltransferase
MRLCFERRSPFNYIVRNTGILTELNISRVLYYFGGKFVKVYSKVMLRMSVVSHSPIPSGAKIIVANHPTGTDPFILFSLLKKRVSILIVDVAFKVPIFGKYIKYIGHIPVNKKRGHIAFKKALKVLKGGGSVVIFMEGDFSPSINKFLKPHTGAVRLALSTGASIIPIGIGVKNQNIKNINSIISGTSTFGKWYFNGPYAVTVGDPVELSGNVENRDLVRILSGIIMSKIRKLALESTVRVASR